ncbi:MAG: HU family DNA-binding protein [candidate division FCPU426 bacterium]
MKDENEATVTKAELAARLSHLGLSRRLARKIVDYFFSLLASSLQRGEVVHLVGFGAFHFKVRQARRGRNPRTGEAVHVPSKQVIQFRPGSLLKRQVRESGTARKRDSHE